MFQMGIAPLLILVSCLVMCFGCAPKPLPAGACPACGGRGFDVLPNPVFFYQFVQTKCEACRGAGKAE
jgi:DnaJ-class molecular chaperone